jgi:hypothetical protein
MDEVNEGEAKMLGYVVLAESRIEMRCRECKEGRVEVAYHFTPFTIEIAAGMVCGKCQRTLGEVALT